MSETNETDSKNDDEPTLDSILVRIGQFGKYQIINYMLICVPMVFNAIFSVTYVFTASPVVHRCNITECDSPTSGYYEQWTNFTIPLKGDNLDQCNRYALMSDKRIKSKYKNDNNQKQDRLCLQQNFDQNTVEKCGSDFKFRDKEVSISNDFGIFCADEWKLSMVGTVNNIGQFLGIPLGGFIADKFGRRTMLAAGGFLSALMGIIRSLSSNYPMFLAFELLDMLVGSTLFPTVFILAIELVGPKRRVFACTVITMFYAVGEVLLALAAKYIQNWRIMLRVLYIPALIHILYFWILPESVRWLLSQNREDNAKEILRKAATINKRKLSEQSLERLVLANREKLLTANESEFPILRAIRVLFWRISNCSLCWFTNTLIALGLSLNSVNLSGGNKYHNFMFSSLITIPGMLLPFLLMDRIGRRYSLCGSMLVCGLCIAGSIFVRKDQYTWELILFLIGKLAITSSFNILYFFTSEIFPTNVRNSMLSLCSMFGRFGSMLAPQTPLMAKYYQYAPQILFATFALVSGSMTLLFPETTDKVLPTTMDDANYIGGRSSQQEKKREVEML